MPPRIMRAGERVRRRRSTLALVLLAAGYIGLVTLGIQLGGWITGALEIDIHHSPETDALWHRLVLLAFATFVALMALPFVPGVEIGLALLVVFGAELALLVYLGTVLALSLGFLIGRLVPETAIVWAFERAHLRRAHALASRMRALPVEDRLRVLLDASPARSLSRLVHWRYVAIALALNLPGNALIGGGGGIAIAAGMSRLFSFPGYLLTIALATAPVPLLVALTEPASGVR